MSEAGASRSDLRAAVRDLLQDLVSESSLRAAIDNAGARHERLWTRLLEMGVIELAAASVRREVEGSHLDLAVVFEELGRALAPVPAHSTALAVSALDASGHPELLQWVPELVSGKRRAAVAVDADELLAPRAPVGATLAAGGARVTGSLSSVVDAASADCVLLVAEHDGDLDLFMVRTDTPMVRISATEPFDLTRTVADIELAAAPAILVGDAGSGGQRAAALLQLSWLLQAADQVGVAQRALDEAVGYAKVRTQFGRTIGSFQAIKHSCVDMLVQAEGARCLVEAAAEAMDGASLEEAAVSVSLAAAYANEAACDNAERSMQIHGGIGYTWEHVSHVILRRAKASSLRYATTSAHWQAVARGLGGAR